MTIPKIKQSEFKDFLTRAQYLYSLRTKENEILNYKPNEAQLILDRIRNEEFKRSLDNKGIRQAKILLLKSRQIGGTTDTAMFNFDTMLNLQHAFGIIIAHDDRSTSVIYDKYKHIYNYLPEYVQIVGDDGQEIYDGNGNPLLVSVKPEKESYSGHRLEFADKTKSRLVIRTAGSGDNVGRGDTMNLVHLSECGFYTHFDDVLYSINQTLPKNGMIYSVLESTANGVSGKGEAFYDLWTKSTQEWKRFENGQITSFEGYRPIFIPWYYLDEYRQPLMGGKLIDVEAINFGSNEKRKEFHEMEDYLVEEVFDNRDEGLEAINWYRWCIKENCKYNLTIAHQEYPTTPEQAFISTDNCFFDTPKLFHVKQTYEQKGEPEHKIGYINDDFEFIESKTGDLKVWEESDKSYVNRYIVSLDPSMGYEGGDYSCMMVYDRLEDDFVAKWYGNMKEDLVAEELLKVAYYYNEALIIPEINLNTVITLIRPEGNMPYTGDIYVREVKSRNSVEYGYHTLGGTRKTLLDLYSAWLRENYFKIKDLDSLDEHLSFIKRVTNGLPRYEAAQGKHDDQVIASALCIIGAEWWEEEIAHVDYQMNDYDMIVEPKSPSKKRLFKNSSLGTGVASVARNSKKPLKQSSLGN